MTFDELEKEYNKLSKDIDILAKDSQAFIDLYNQDRNSKMAKTYYRASVYCENQINSKMKKIDKIIAMMGEINNKNASSSKTVSKTSTNKPVPKKDEVKYCYVRLNNSTLHYIYTNLTKGYEDSYDYVDNVRIEGSFRHKTSYPLPIMCKVVNNKRIYDCVTGEEYIYSPACGNPDYAKANWDNNTYIKIDKNRLSYIPVFREDRIIEKEYVVNNIRDLSSADIVRYCDGIAGLKKALTKDYYEANEAIRNFEALHSNDDDFLDNFPYNHGR